MTTDPNHNPTTENPNSDTPEPDTLSPEAQAFLTARLAPRPNDPRSTVHGPRTTNPPVSLTETLLGYLLGDLPDGEAAEVEARLVASAPLRRRLSETLDRLEATARTDWATLYEESVLTLPDATAGERDADDTPFPLAAYLRHVARAVRAALETARASLQPAPAFALTRGNSTGEGSTGDAPETDPNLPWRAVATIAGRATVPLVGDAPPHLEADGDAPPVLIAHVALAPDADPAYRAHTLIVQIGAGDAWQRLGATPGDGSGTYAVRLPCPGLTEALGDATGPLPPSLFRWSLVGPVGPSSRS